MSRGWESVKKQPGIWQTAGITGAAALFALWHFQDVRNGAAASGDLWLRGSYGLLAVYGLLLVAGLGYLVLIRDGCP